MPPTTDSITDVGAALAYAESHALPDTVTLPDGRILVREQKNDPNTLAILTTWRELDPQGLDPSGPRRPKGTRNVFDGASFLAAMAEFTGQRHAVVYADESTRTLVAVLNDDSAGAPGWRDDRVSLALRRTPAWEAWVNGQGLGPQARFAERIEDGLPEIRQPDGATMLELAQTFHATVGSRVKSGQRLSSGEVKFVWEESTEATGGVAGDLTLPDVFTLAVQPFYGSAVWACDARFRYRVSNGTVIMGYQLVRPDDVELGAFAQVVDEVQTGLEAEGGGGITVLRGAMIDRAD